MMHPNIATIPFAGLKVGFKVWSPISQRTGYRYLGEIAEMKPKDRHNPNRIGCVFPAIGEYIEVGHNAADVLLAGEIGVREGILHANFP